ncbi:hypothetical protein V6N13_124197 [Hibiscus sabdariffa]
MKKIEKSILNPCLEKVESSSESSSKKNTVHSLASLGRNSYLEKDVSINILSWEVPRWGLKSFIVKQVEVKSLWEMKHGLMQRKKNNDTTREEVLLARSKCLDLCTLRAKEDYCA